jgi:UDP-N-acetyl-2-amino-2-deoxyglucuronate dehydrogenase
MRGARPKNFAVIGAAGYVAARHLGVIAAMGHRIVAACDPSESAGILDRYSFDVEYFHDTATFELFLGERARGPEHERIDFVVVCSPNDLHVAHASLALTAGADVICEKPTVLDPRDLDLLSDLERATGRRVYTVLQLRYHAGLRALHARLQAAPASQVHDVQLIYVAPRGPWYDISWKGDEQRSGGVLVNIGIHLFDVLTWCFGDATSAALEYRDPRRAAGTIDFPRAHVRWFLSTRAADLHVRPENGGSLRRIVVDGESVEFGGSVAPLHSRVYDEVLAGRGLRLDECRSSIGLISRIRGEALRSQTTASLAGRL